MTTRTLALGEVFEGSALRPTACERCGQAHLVPEALVGVFCPACGRGVLEASEARLRPEPPELIVPFALERADLRGVFRGFLRGVRFRPAELDVEALTARAVRVLWPMWLVDAQVVGHWRAEVGFDYDVESAQEVYSGGGWTSHRVVETRIRWEPRVGQVSRRYDNLPVPALSDHDRLTARIGHYALDSALPFEASLVGEAAMRVPDQRPETVWPVAEETFKHAAGEDCELATGAQHIREFYLAARHEDLEWTWLLLPLWVTVYADDRGVRHAVVVNGQTGEVGGTRRSSMKKGLLWAGILAAVALVLFVVGLVLTLLGLLFPPLWVVSVVVFALAFVPGLGALWPALWPWRWNRAHPGPGT